MKMLAATALLLTAALVAFVAVHTPSRTAAPVTGGTTATTTPTQYFAQVKSDGTISRVIVASQSFIDSGVVGDPSTWVETYLDGHARGAYAGKGYTYDKASDTFILPAKARTPGQVEAATTTPI